MLFRSQNVVAVSAGLQYSLALLNTGKVIAWGLNSNNRATIPGSVNNAVAIAASYTNSAISLRNGQVIVVGAKLSNALITRTPTPGPLLP